MVVVVSVVVVAVVVGEVVVVGGVVVVVVGSVVGAVVTVVVGADVTVGVPSPPPSAAITASASTNPRTAATSKAIAHLAPRLMPPGGGGPEDGSGWPMWRVGSSCTGGRV